MSGVNAHALLSLPRASGIMSKAVTLAGHRWQHILVWPSPAAHALLLHTSSVPKAGIAGPWHTHVHVAINVVGAAGAWMHDHKVSWLAGSAQAVLLSGLPRALAWHLWVHGSGQGCTSLIKWWWYTKIMVTHVSTATRTTKITSNRSQAVRSLRAQRSSSLHLQLLCMH